MSGKQPLETNPNEPSIYEIRVKGHLSHDWEDWFENVSIRQGSEGETILTCTIRDQAALHGLLRRIRDLGVPLISVVRIDPDISEE